MEVKDFLKGKIVYDEHGANIHCVQDSNGHCQNILDVRGFGAIQNLFMNKDGSVRMDEAVAFQDKMGIFLAKAIEDALNKKDIVDEPNSPINFGNYLCENYIPFEDKFWIDAWDKALENPIKFTTSELYEKYKKR